MLREQVQASYRKPELPSVCQLAYACTQVCQLISGYLHHQGIVSDGQSLVGAYRGIAYRRAIREMPRTGKRHYVCGSPHQAFPYIVNPVLVQPQNIVLITPLDQMPYVLPDVFVQLLKDGLCLLHAQNGLCCSQYSKVVPSQLLSSVRAVSPPR